MRLLHPFGARFFQRLADGCAPERQLAAVIGRRDIDPDAGPLSTAPIRQGMLEVHPQDLWIVPGMAR